MKSVVWQVGKGKEEWSYKAVRKEGNQLRLWFSESVSIRSRGRQLKRTAELHPRAPTLCRRGCCAWWVRGPLENYLGGIGFFCFPEETRDLKKLHLYPTEKTN